MAGHRRATPVRLSGRENALPRFDQMQGLILSAYPDLEHAAYLLYTIRDLPGAKTWLHRVRSQITPALKPGELGGISRGPNVNIAFTAAGLAKLCGIDARTDDVPELPLLQAFPYAFTEGMAGRDHRRRILGSTGDSAPEKWTWGGPSTEQDQQIHVLLMVFARTEAALAASLAEIAPGENVMAHVELPVALPLNPADRREHFGFNDGISQPILEGTTDARRFPESSHLTALGEIVLGYPDGTGHVSPVPGLDGSDRFGVNGTYLVFCQLQQHVAAFWNFACRETGASEPGDAAAMGLAAKMVGRRPDGTPLVPYTNRDDNEFAFADDPYGYGCPFGAHVRRSNPRDSMVNANEPQPSAISANRHRIMRRGRLYGEKLENLRQEDHKERGLFFVCLNADIERQFEFIQQNWINNPAFLGLQHERDPLIGDHAAGDTPSRVFTIPGLPAPTCIDGLERFITVRGGQYFFLPGMDALQWLAGDGSLTGNGRS